MHMLIRAALTALTLAGALTTSPAAALAAQTSAPAQEAAAAFARGVALHDAGKYAEAIPELERAVALGFQPINQARFRLVRALAKHGDTDKALTLLEQLAAGGFQNTSVVSGPDLSSLASLPRFQAAVTRINNNAHPCAADANYRAFDFWIGEWDVQPTGPQRAPIGQGAASIIERQLDGCAIQENWLPIGGVGAGKSFNIYNRVSKMWEQYYVDTNGTITHYTGTFRDGTLYYEADQFASTNKIRMTFFNQGPNQVR
jgi:pentatricopeptide repeat protein